MIGQEDTRRRGPALRKEAFMSVLRSDKRQELLAEVEGLPDEYVPLLLQMIRAYRESVALKPAADSFRTGWEEAKAGETFPVDRLWEGIDVE